MERHSLPYTPYYCEENVYRLLERAFEEGTEALRLPFDSTFVLTISNRVGAVPMRRQRARDGGIVHWDYHVIVLAREEFGSYVFDLDSTLPFPSPTEEYMRESFPEVPAERSPLFKCLTADYYLAVFHSDRRHMIAGGEYTAPPPPWEAIRPELGSMVTEMTDMRHGLYGRPLPLELVRRL